MGHVVPTNEPDLETLVPKEGLVSLATPQSRTLPAPARRAKPGGLGRHKPTDPAFVHRVMASMRRANLDHRLANGERIEQPLMVTRAWQISRVQERANLASALESVIRDAEVPRRGISAAVPIRRAEVLDAREEIRRLARRLRDPRPAQPKGVALVRQLLTLGDGPLYTAAAPDALRHAVRDATDELD